MTRTTTQIARAGTQRRGVDTSRTGEFSASTFEEIGLSIDNGEIARLQAQLAAMQTARNAYLEALRRELPAG